MFLRRPGHFPWEQARSVPGEGSLPFGNNELPKHMHSFVQYSILRLSEPKLTATHPATGPGSARQLQPLRPLLSVYLGHRAQPTPVSPAGWS